jgi:hypothetical protein
VFGVFLVAGGSRDAATRVGDGAAGEAESDEPASGDGGSAAKDAGETGGSSMGGDEDHRQAATGSEGVAPEPAAGRSAAGRSAARRN